MVVPLKDMTLDQLRERYEILQQKLKDDCCFRKLEAVVREGEKVKKLIEEKCKESNN